MLVLRIKKMFKKRSDKTLKYFFPFQGKISGTKRIKKNIYQKKIQSYHYLKLRRYLVSIINIKLNMFNVYTLNVKKVYKSQMFKRTSLLTICEKLILHFFNILRTSNFYI